ncbi:uncharacterized protein C1orf131 homolog [Brachyistius frenatus]|uniref:uncharacterized protein C1orf131 homolog n=1 Tax=Brachyistius frenatus TaxID=100188 RepID=UPI0037E79295
MSSRSNGREDEVFLENVLDELYDFGSGPKQKSQKKKKRKRCAEDEDEDEGEELPPVEELGSEDDGAERRRPKAERTGPNIRQVNRVEVVTFQDPRKRTKTEQTPTANKKPALQIAEKNQSDQPEEIDLEKARLEVHRFGITGYKKEQQRVFEQDRAVMLGARPLKKNYVNYKELQQQIKDRKEKAKEVQPDLKKKKKKPNVQRDKKKTASSAPSGQVGRFKNGMLILSSKEIQNIKGKKRRR